jgi:hypothetical protein
MGCFDIYCKVCGGPFTPYPAQYFPEMTGIDTNWLGQVVVDYKNGVKVDATSYDSYGSFKCVATGKQLDAGLDVCDGNVIVYHKQCVGKTVPNNKFKVYQQQHFDIFTMIKKQQHHLLDKSLNN